MSGGCLAIDTLMADLERLRRIRVLAAGGAIRLPLMNPPTMPNALRRKRAVNEHFSYDPLPPMHAGAYRFPATAERKNVDASRDENRDVKRITASTHGIAP